MTSPPPAAPHGRPHRHAATGAAGVTRIVQTDDLPPGVDALASADGRTVIVRASLDQVSRRRAMREVMASVRRFPRLALYPAISAEAIRQLLRRLMAAVNWVTESVQQVTSMAGDHVSGLAVAATAAAGTVAVVTVVVATAAPNAGSGASHLRPSVTGTGTWTGGPHPKSVARLSPKPLSYLGVYEDGVPDSFTAVTQFQAAVGVQPNIALYYSSFYEQFKTAFADQAYDDDMIPAIQIEPFGVSMAGIAAGKYDSTLIAFADQVRAYRNAVIIGFAHEPNGTWYPWGSQSVSPAVWIAAWRHVVDVFTAQGADNVTWLWTVNSQGPEAAMAGAWWPGASYVDWIGIDGYYTDSGDDFSNVFGPVLSEVQGYDKPIIISETAVGPGTGDQVSGIDNLFAGLRATKLLGLIWFDKAQDNGQYQQDWRLEGKSALETAFRQAGGYISS